MGNLSIRKRRIRDEVLCASILSSFGCFAIDQSRPPSEVQVLAAHDSRRACSSTLRGHSLLLCFGPRGNEIVPDDLDEVSSDHEVDPSLIRLPFVHRALSRALKS